MAEKKPQTYANHRKLVPMYHFVLLPLMLIYLLWAGWRLVQEPSVDSFMGLLLAFVVAGALSFARVSPLKVQDRLIRLEMQLRLQDLLPEDLRVRVGDLRVGQLVALRFASDRELPDLVRQVLDGQLKTANEIKKAIQDWKPDYFRC